MKNIDDTDMIAAIAHHVQTAGTTFVSHMENALRASGIRSSAQRIRRLVERKDSGLCLVKEGRALVIYPRENFNGGALPEATPQSDQPAELAANPSAQFKAAYAALIAAVPPGARVAVHISLEEEIAKR